MSFFNKNNRAITTSDGGGIPDDNSVTSAKIANNAVTLSKMADNSVGTAELIDGSITNDKIEDGTITNDKLATPPSGVAADSITTTELADDAVEEANILDDAVTQDKIADNAVGTAQLRDGEVTSAKLQKTYVEILDRETTQQVVNSSSTETTIFSHTIPANTLSTNRLLRLTLTFDILANSGTPTFTIRVKLGATTLYAAVSDTHGSSTVRKPGFLMILLNNQNNAAVQAMGGVIFTNSEATTNVTSGIGAINDDELDPAGPVGPFGGSSAIDTTSDRDLVVTIQNSVSNVNVSFRKQGAVLELL